MFAPQGTKALYEVIFTILTISVFLTSVILFTDASKLSDLQSLRQLKVISSSAAIGVSDVHHSMASYLAGDGAKANMLTNKLHSARLRSKKLLDGEDCPEDEECPNDEFCQKFSEYCFCDEDTYHCVLIPYHSDSESDFDHKDSD